MVNRNLNGKYRAFQYGFRSAYVDDSDILRDFILADANAEHRDLSGTKFLGSNDRINITIVCAIADEHDAP